MDGVGTGRIGRGLGDEKGRAALAELDAAGDDAVVGGGEFNLGKRVFIAVDLHDFASRKQETDLVQETRTEFFGKVELTEKGGVVDGAVAGSAENGEQGIAESHELKA